MAATGTLHRKQYLLSDSNLVKIAQIQSTQGKSAAEVVRDAIEAYNPSASMEDDVSPKAVEFLAEQLHVAINDTKAANQRVETLLSHLEHCD